MSSKGTPRKLFNSATETLMTPSTGLKQEEQKKRLGGILKGHSWQFPPHDIARMLSPKELDEAHRDQPRHPIDGFRHLLDHFDCLIDEPVVQGIMNDVFADPPVCQPMNQDNERANYVPVASFLNACVRKCNEAYDLMQVALPGKIRPKSDRYLPNLWFEKYDRNTGDGILRSHPLKPDVVCVLSNGPIGRNALCYWNLPIKRRRRQCFQIVFALEFKELWSPLVAQSATYGRCELTAAPLSAFAVVFGINHKDGTIRVQIFHHGGVSTNTPLSVTNVQDCRALLEILMSIILWQTPVDAGLPEFTDGESWVFPSGRNATARGEQEAVLYYHPSIRSRETFVASVIVKSFSQKSTAADVDVVATQLGGIGIGEQAQGEFPELFDEIDEEAPSVVPRARLYGDKHHIKFFDHEPSREERKYQSISSGRLVVKCAWPSYLRSESEAAMYKACRGEFGTPTLFAAYEPFTSKYHCITNSYFLPPPGANLAEYFWGFDGSSEAASEPDYRSLVIAITRDQGEGLDLTKSPWELCECICQAMLGWLSIFQSGYMQRDVSIGNILKLRTPVEMRPFSVQKLLDYRDALLHNKPQPGVREIEDKVGQLANLVASNETALAAVFDGIVKDALALEDLVRNKLGFTSSCKAVLSDGDLAAYMPMYFANPHDKGQLSGTIEFMSQALCNAAFSRSPYLHKPTDDLNAFLNVTTFMTVMHPDSRGSSEREKEWQEQLYDKDGRHSVLSDFRNRLTIRADNEKEYKPLVRAMYKIIREWGDILQQLENQMIEELLDEKHKNEVLRNQLVSFEKFAYHGVFRMLEVVAAHRDELIKLPLLSSN